MIFRSNRAFWLLASGMGGGWLLVAAPAFGDAALEHTQRLLTQAIRDTKETPLNQNPDTSNVITALRMANDKDLLPVFQKLRHSNAKENRIYGMISEAVITKDPQKIDLPLLFSVDDMALVGSGVATLIDAEIPTVEQLEKIVADAPREVHKAMAVGELSRRKALTDRSMLARMLKSSDDVVRYYTAVTILETKDSPDAAEALSLLRTMNDKHDLRQAAVQATMIVRVQKQKIMAAGPWIVQMATDEKNDEGLRYTAVSALLTLRHPDGPRILADMIQKQTEVTQQVKLGLIALEGAGGSEATGLKASMLEPLTRSQVGLVKELAKLAQQGANGEDITPGLLELIKLGHPIVLDWALANSESGDASRKLEIRKAIIAQATAVDGIRGRDYERAARAAQRILEDNGPEGRKVIADFLKNNNRAIVEAVLAGTYRSGVANEAELVLPIWDALSKSTAETSANYAALILAREGRQEPLAWLSGMVLGGTVQNTGFRALAGWYYAKLIGQNATLLNKALAE
ncbi:MAG: HEAT repeat domain-containing protein [Phycisphaerales bacterium]|nr:HEAT repeat domain-containing protein [Phycisphaerales bacterium]